MNKILALSFLALLSACGGKKDTATSCTKQDLNSKTIIVGCITQKQDKPGKCTAAGANTSVCEIGFDSGCQQARIEPLTIKAYVRETKTVADSEEIILINKATNKQMYMKQIDNYVILKHFDDPGNTSTVDLPVCPEI